MGTDLPCGPEKMFQVTNAKEETQGKDKTLNKNLKLDLSDENQMLCHLLP
jgi:hypothetical protein